MNDAKEVACVGKWLWPVLRSLSLHVCKRTEENYETRDDSRPPCAEFCPGTYQNWSAGFLTNTIRKREEQCLEAAQMKFLRHLLGITKLDKEKNQCVREKTGAQNIVKEIKQYQKKWLQHVQRMDTNRIPKQALRYRPKGRRNIGRPKKRWRDQLHFED